jgi:hypothetical protein
VLAEPVGPEEQDRRGSFSVDELARRIAAVPFYEDLAEEYPDPDDYPGPDPYDLWANK